MIKEGIIVVGLVFYAFVISTLVKDISTVIVTQEKKTSPNPSSGLSITIKMGSSLSKKWKISTPALNMRVKNSWESSDNMAAELISTNFLISWLPRWVTLISHSAQDGGKMCRKHLGCFQSRTFEESQQSWGRKGTSGGLWSWWRQRNPMGWVQYLQPPHEEAT